MPSWLNALSLFTKDNIVIAFLLAILIGIGYIIYFVATARSQLNNHLPTQINDLKESQKEIKSEIKALSHIPIEINVLKEGQKEIKADQSKMRSELRNDIEKLDKKFDQTNQKIEQNYKDMTAQNNQNFKELVSLIIKQRTGT